ncbi:MAG: GDSL-type esterase/lipase family protein [Mariniphaga sp.]
MLYFCITGIYAQEKKTAWDNTNDKNWPTGFIKKEIQSTIDGTIQKAWFYPSQLAKPQPLIVSLHTWSGDYNQEDPLTKEVLIRDWNYIHPDFRGANNRPEAGVSELVISDIEDAIQFAIKNGNVDLTNIHIIGVSGGGLATLVCYMKLKYPVKSFNAWASISDLESWYQECKVRGLKYANDIEMITTNGKGFDASEARKRSPLLMDFHPELRKGSFLNIYAGIHDGYTGSVPISQSMKFFNRILDEIMPSQLSKKISDSMIQSLVINQINSNPDTLLTLGGRNVHLIREVPGLCFTLFEGTHEMIVPQALALIPIDGEKNRMRLNVLTIGDSNAAAEFGYPYQLSKLLPNSTIINKSISGNTIGFDNLDQPKLNTLTNINRYLEEAYSDLGKDKELDYILIGLGTNDTKRIFIDRQKEVPQNLSRLMEMVKGYFTEHNRKMPAICIVSPPPMDGQKANVEKYGGSTDRILKNNLKFKKVADKNHVGFLNVYEPLLNGFPDKTLDGVHLNEKAQFEMAKLIAKYLVTR